MKEALVSPDLKVRVVESPVPAPAPGQVLIRVVAAGMNPKDWRVPEYLKWDGNQGDDVAGYIEAVGEGAATTEFRKGDRVAAFHQMATPHGAYAEYAVAWAHTTFHIPERTSFEEAATIPLAALTTVLALYHVLRLPCPFMPPLPTPAATGAVPSPSRGPQPTTPLIIYGAASAIGLYALRLALRSNIHPLVCVAGSSGARLVAPLLDTSRGDVVLDYRDGDDALVLGIRRALGDGEVAHVYDCVSTSQSEGVLAHVLAPRSGASSGAASAGAPGGNGVGADVVDLAVIDPKRPFDLLPENVRMVRVDVGWAHRDETRELAYVFCRYFTRGLEQGWFRGHPHRLLDGGFDGIEIALADLKGERVHGEKFVCRPADTPGVEGTAPGDARL